MKQLHYKQEMKYLNAVADYLIELGYGVVQPTTDYRESLTVWGMYKNTKCHLEISVSMYACHNGINGVWHQGEHDGIELFLDLLPNGYGLDTRNDIEILFDGLKPFKKGKLV